MIRRGKALSVTTDQLGEWVYGTPPASGREARRRREEVRHGIEELGRLSGWELSENRRRLMVSVARAASAGGRDADCAPQSAAQATEAAASEQAGRKHAKGAGRPTSCGIVSIDLSPSQA